LLQRFEKICELLNSSTYEQKIVSQFQKRLGTLYWLNNCHDGNNVEKDVCHIWLKAYNLTPDDYQLNVCLASYYWKVIIFFLIKALNFLK